MKTRKTKNRKENKQISQRYQAGGNTKSQVFLALALLIITILATLSMAKQAAAIDIQLISQIDPVEYGLVQQITLNITSSSTINHTIISFEDQDHDLQKQGQQYVYSWMPSIKGNYTYTVHASDTANATAELSGSFIVQDTTPPEIIETSPNGTLDYNLIELKAITNENSTCRYDMVDVSFDSMTVGLSGDGVVHSKLRSFGDGDYLVYVRCKDQSNNAGESTTIMFNMDTTPPAISSITPTGTIADSKPSLRFNTDENAICRWSQTSQEYSIMANTFTTTGSTLHEQPIGLSEGINTYYISCQDNTGNYNAAIALNLELNLPPTASISVRKNESYRAIRLGIYEVLMTTSEALSTIPSLTMSYCGNSVGVPMEGSNTNWKGYLIMSSENIACVGEFSYRGTDSKGTVGTEITGGRLLLVDTTKPNIPSIPKLANQDNKIKISWSYDGEETNHYNIYRSTTGQTDKSNFQAQSTASTYFDSDITDKIGYFYRISAVDKAGNEGELSEEEFIMTDFANDTAFQQDPEISSLLTQKIAELELKIQLIDNHIDELNQKSDERINELIKQQGMISSLENAKSNLQTLVGELKSYRDIKLAKQEVSFKIQLVTSKAAEISKKIITDVRVVNNIETEQLLDPDTIKASAGEYLKNKALTEKQSKEYLARISSLQETTRITRKLTAYEIDYESAESKNILSVSVKVFAPNEATGMLLQEVLPKEKIRLADMTFNIEPIDLNTLGPIWNLNSLQESTLSYQIDASKELVSLKEIKAILLIRIDDFLREKASANESNAITGGVIGSSGDTAGTSLNKYLIYLAAFIMLALASYYVFFLRTEKKSEQDAIASFEQNSFNPDLIKTRTDAGLSPDGIISEQSNLIGGAKEVYILIEKAWFAVKTGDVLIAQQNYTSALQIYSKSRFGLKDRLKINLEMNALYDELLKKAG